MKGVAVYQSGLGIDDKLRSKNGNTVRYFLTDHLGSTVALTDASGKITSSTTYDSFGNAIPKQAAGSAASGIGSAASSTGSAASSTGNATSNIATTYRYTGREYDEETGLYYYRNRWYDPETGRFISEDPIGFAGGDINLYGYVGNNPQNFVDPSGNYACGPQKDQKDVCKDAKLVRIYGLKFTIQKEFTIQREGNIRKKKRRIEKERRKFFFAPDFAKSLVAAFRELNEHGIEPQINSGFRNEKDQTGLRKGGAGKNPVAKGTSLHQAGYAVDINGTKDPKFKTIRRVMKKHGFSWGGYFKEPDPPHFFMNPFGRKGTETFQSNLKAAAAAANKYYKERIVTCLELGN